MFSDSHKLQRVFSGLVLLSVVACFATAGCSDIRPEPNDEGGGLLESPTHEADTLHETEQHQEQHH